VHKGFTKIKISNFGVRVKTTTYLENKKSSSIFLDARFEVPTTALLRIQSYCDMMLCCG
jgi:hypothetical protein